MVVRIAPAPGGFGLVEMLVVIAVLSVLTLGATMLAYRGDNGLNTTAALLIDDARAARDLAMVTGLDHALALTPGGWDMVRQSGSGWTTLTTRDVTAAVSSPTRRWVLHADGAADAVTVTLSADGVTRLCRRVPPQTLRCR